MFDDDNVSLISVQTYSCSWSCTAIRSHSVFYAQIYSHRFVIRIGFTFVQPLHDLICGLIDDDQDGVKDEQDDDEYEHLYDEDLPEHVREQVVTPPL